MGMRLWVGVVGVMLWGAWSWGEDAATQPFMGCLVVVHLGRPVRVSAWVDAVRLQRRAKGWGLQQPARC